MPRAIGVANLEARSGNAVVTSLQINVGSKVKGTIFVDDFATTITLGYSVRCSPGSCPCVGGGAFFFGTETIPARVILISLLLAAWTEQA